MKKITMNGALMFFVLFALMAAGCKSQKKVAKNTAQEDVQIKQYCPATEYPTTNEMIRARGRGMSHDMIMSGEAASAKTLQNLAKQIGVSVKSVIDNYNNRRQNNLNENVVKRTEELTRQVINKQITGYRVVCNKVTKNTKTNVYTTYYVYELPVDNVLKPVYNSISKDDELKIDYDYQKFKKEFEDAIKNNGNK